MRSGKIFAGLGLAAILAAGCHTKAAVDNNTFKTALDNYYSGRPVCLFQERVKFPGQADTSNEEQTKSFDALTDAGMLTRVQGNKQRLPAGSKQGNGYDLSPKGRTKWTAEPAQPGYGNFCFGAPQVTAVNNYTALDSGGDAYTVSYQYSVILPDRVRTDEMMTAFPSIDRMSAPRTATANLTRSNGDWEVQDMSASAPMPRQVM